MKPPPRPLSFAEFRRRWTSGARTMRDLDPALHAWAYRGGWRCRWGSHAWREGWAFFLQPMRARRCRRCGREQVFDLYAGGWVTHPDDVCASS